MDYRKYWCNLWERLGCLAAGTAVAAAIAWLFYRSWYGMVLVIPVNYLIVSYYKNKKRDERAKKLMIEFRDAIQAVAAALLAGYSIEHAWKEAEREIMDLYGKEAMITKELIQMNAEIKLNRNVEEILHDLAVRSGVEEIQSFAEIFGFAKRSGGDFPQIIRTTAARISAKIEVEREVDTVIAGKKLEGKIMSVMPFFILALLKIFPCDASLPIHFCALEITLICALYFGTNLSTIEKIKDNPGIIRPNKYINLFDVITAL